MWEFHFSLLSLVSPKNLYEPMMSRMELFSTSEVTQIECQVKIWRFNNSIYDLNQWIKIDDPEDCEGLVFPENLNGIEILQKLVVREIVLPRTGAILLSEDAEIIIDPNSTDKMNCATLDESQFSKHLFWMDSGNWIMKGYEGNVAVPHMERVPCEFDEVIFPAGLQTRGFQIFGYNIKIKKFKFGNEYWTNDDLSYYMDSDVISRIIILYTMVESILAIKGTVCEDPFGCACGNELTNSGTCWYGLLREFNPDDVECINPIKPNGFCHEICGASILFKPRRNFRIDELQRKLRKYTSDTYASKVNIGQFEFIQIVFAEKNFTGISLDEANDMHEQLLTDKNLGAKQVELNASGPYYRKGLMLKSTLLSVFGTLFGVLVVLILLFLIFTTTLIETISNRLTFGSNPISIQTSKYFARYRTSDAGPIIEVQSLAESMVNLDRAFENPMYKETSPSTSTTSDETGPEVSNAFSKTELEVESEHFPFKEEEVEDISEKNELINLSTDNM